MVSKLSLVVALSMVLLGSLLPESSSAAHGKAHHHEHHGKRIRRHASHAKSTLAEEYVDNNFDKVYAMCAFEHFGRWYLPGGTTDIFSIAFFDEQGELLDMFCTEGSAPSFERVTAQSQNVNGWSTVTVDDQSKCFMHGNERKSAVDLLNSYEC